MGSVERRRRRRRPRARNHPYSSLTQPNQRLRAAVERRLTVDALAVVVGVELGDDVVLEAHLGLVLVHRRAALAAVKLAEARDVELAAGCCFYWGWTGRGGMRGSASRESERRGVRAGARVAKKGGRALAKTATERGAFQRRAPPARIQSPMRAPMRREFGRGARPGRSRNAKGAGRSLLAPTTSAMLTAPPRRPPARARPARSHIRSQSSSPEAWPTARASSSTIAKLFIAHKFGDVVVGVGGVENLGWFSQCVNKRLNERGAFWCTCRECGGGNAGGAAAL